MEDSPFRVLQKMVRDKFIEIADDDQLINSRESLEGNKEKGMGDEESAVDKLQHNMNGENDGLSNEEHEMNNSEFEINTPNNEPVLDESEFAATTNNGPDKPGTPRGSGLYGMPTLQNKSTSTPVSLLGQYLLKSGHDRRSAFSFIHTESLGKKYVCSIGKEIFKCRSLSLTKQEVCKRFLNSVYPGMYSLDKSLPKYTEDTDTGVVRKVKRGWLHCYYMKLGLSELWDQLAVNS